MRYSVRFANRAGTQIIEADEMHPMGNGQLVFYADRIRNRPGNDQWGNPRTMPTRVTVAVFSNVDSAVEIPEEDPGLQRPETGGMVDEFTAVRWDQHTVGFGNGQLPPIVDERVFADFATIPPPAPIPVGTDDDGINWTAQQAD